MNKKELYQNIRGFSALYLRYAEELEDLARKGLIQGIIFGDENKFENSLKNARQQIETLLLLNEELNSGNNRKALDQIISLFLFGLGLLSDSAIENLPIHMRKRSDSLKDLETRLFQVITGMRDSMRRSSSQSRFILKKKISGSVNLNLVATVENPEKMLMECQINAYSPNKMSREVRKIAENPGCLAEAAAKFGAETIVLAFADNPWMAFGNNVELYIRMDMQERGMCIPLSNSSRYIITIPFKAQDCADMLACMNGGLGIRNTCFYEISVHELTHLRDLYVTTGSIEAIGLASKRAKEPSRKLIGYMEAIVHMRAEGYATFVQWIASSRVGKTLIFSPQQMSSSRQNCQLHRAFLQHGEIFKGFYQSPDLNRGIPHLEAANYYVGALAFTFMLLYHLRIWINSKAYIVLTEKKYLMSILSDPESFWKSTPAERERILQLKGIQTIHPKNLGKLNSSDYTIITSPELWPKIETLLKLFSMTPEAFFKDASQACSYCGFGNTVFFDANFINAVEGKKSQADKALVAAAF